MLGFRLHPVFYQYALSPRFLRRMTLNPPPCPEPVFWPRDQYYGNPCKNPHGWTHSRQTPPSGWPLSDDRQTLTAHAASEHYHRHDRWEKLLFLAARRAVR